MLIWHVECSSSHSVSSSNKPSPSVTQYLCARPSDRSRGEGRWRERRRRRLGVAVAPTQSCSGLPSRRAARAWPSSPNECASQCLCGKIPRRLSGGGLLRDCDQRCLQGSFRPVHARSPAALPAAARRHRACLGQISAHLSACLPETCSEARRAGRDRRRRPQGSERRHRARKRPPKRRWRAVSQKRRAPTL